MILNDNEFQNDDHNPEQDDNKPNAYRVDDDDDLTEEDLQQSYPASKDDVKKQDEHGMEGKGMGGQNFGENNLTPSGDDKANPSQTAGYNNEYFRRTQPAEEHPENNNFKDPRQAGQPDYNKSVAGLSHLNEEDEGGKDNQNEKSPHPQQPYQEGTADDDGNNDKKQANIPGPNETPDQQKVGE